MRPKAAAVSSASFLPTPNHSAASKTASMLGSVQPSLLKARAMRLLAFGALQVKGGGRRPALCLAQEGVVSQMIVAVAGKDVEELPRPDFPAFGLRAGAAFLKDKGQFRIGVLFRIAVAGAQQGHGRRIRNADFSAAGVRCAVEALGKQNVASVRKLEQPCLGNLDAAA